MKIKNVFTILLLVLLAQYAAAVDGEYVFQVTNLPPWYISGNGNISVEAISSTTVYDENFDQITDYQSASHTISWPVTACKFDWFMDADAGYPILAYSVYKIQGQSGGNYFYFSFMDCYYGTSIYEDDPQHAYIGVDRYFQYDYGNDVFKY